MFYYIELNYGIVFFLLHGYESTNYILIKWFHLNLISSRELYSMPGYGMFHFIFCWNESICNWNKMDIILILYYRYFLFSDTTQIFVKLIIVTNSTIHILKISIVLCNILSYNLLRYYLPRSREHLQNWIHYVPPLLWIQHYQE